MIAQEPGEAGDGIISGVVVDQITQSPIPGATVRVLGTSRGAATNSDGAFRIEGLPIGTYRIEVSSVGFEPLILTDIVVTTARPQSVRVELNEAAVETEGVTIRPDYFSRNRATPTSTQTLQNEEIRRLPGGFEDVVRAISTLPGVAQVSNGRNDLLVRGGAPSENLYLIDGVESPNINHFGTQGAGGGPLSFVNLDFVRETTFSTGGFGAKYGDKISSVLTIDLRDGRTDQTGGKATISASQFGLNLEGPVTENGSYLFSVRRSYLDLIFRAAGFSFVPEYWDFFGKFDYKLGQNDRLSGLVIAAIDQVKFFNDDEDDAFDNSRILDNTQNQLIAGLTWKHLFSNGYVNTTLGRTLIAYEFNQADTLLNPIFENNSTEDEFNLRIDALLQLGQLIKGSDLSFGGNVKTVGFTTDLLLQQVEPKLEVNLDERFYKGAFYAQLSSPLFEKLLVTLGGRLDWFSGIEEELYPSYRSSLSYPFTDRLRLSLSAGRYFQSPSYIWLAANEENRKLKSIKTDVAVLGLEQLLSDDFKVSVEAYRKIYNDYPASTTRPYLVLANTGAGFGGADEGFASFGLEPLASAGTGEAYGVEFFAQKKLSESPWYGIASLSINKGTFTAIDGVERPSNFDQRVIFNVSGGWKISDTWELGTKFRFATGRPYTPVDSTGDPTFGYQVVDQYNTLRLDPTHQLDLRVDKRWPFSGWNLITYIDIQNIYNSKSPTPPRWNSRTRVGEVSDPIGILPSIGVSAEW
ncbi:MAG: TonB-dependent receptor [Ignavibacteriae bacterium]|nr:TonB-dependent receptor [Ignavibacteriota bacterium]MCB9214518.1 TonB-dependent receptor [Ignavibacteria bacterium]